MADSIVSLVVTELSTFIRQQGNLLGELKKEVQYISDELGHMRAFLLAAESKEEDNLEIQEWVKQVREAAYEIEDVLDEFTLLFAPRHATGFCSCLKRVLYRVKNVKDHHRIASEIQAIKNRIKNISDARQRYKIENTAVGSPPVIVNSWWDDAVLEGKAKLVGIQEPKLLLISQLLGGDDGGGRLKVISVVGERGIGKTTLVRKVHEDAEVTNQFPIRVWVTASSPSRSMMEVLKDLIGQIQKPISQMAGSTVEGLKSILRNLLQMKRYAIVFDDVSDMNFWNSIKSALPENNNRSRVTLTTSIPAVAQASGLESQPYVHTMKPLSSKQSWDLFCDRTFKGNCPNHLKNIVVDILGKCAGLPLAILTMGGLLASKDRENIEEWKKVQHSIEEEEGSQEVVRKIIHLNYKSLPSPLRTCLLYMSIFPQNYEIQSHHLIQLWIAERFVQGQREMTDEEVAMDNLKQLIRRSLIQVVELSWDGSPYKCRVHDLMRDMILRKSQEQNMVSIVTGHHIRVLGKVYRLALLSPAMHSTKEHRDFSHLRTLVTLGNLESPRTDVLEELLSSKLLKVLDLRDANLEEIPDGVFKLYQLKYLHLRGTKIKSIPESIKKLQNLEHLHLGDTRVTELPKGIKKLKKLRHLRVFQAVIDSSDIGYYQFKGFKPPSTIGELHSLHTLLFIDAQNEKTTIVGEIGKLIHLRELGITKLRPEDGKGLCSSLEKLSNLQELDVGAIQREEVIDMNTRVSRSSLQSLRSLILRGKLNGLPPWIQNLQSLIKIELTWSMLRENTDPLGSLHQLPNLVHISFTQAYQGEGLHFKAGGFKKLEMLNLKNMDGLRRMVIEQGSMPRLRQLHLSELPSLEDLPVGIEHLRQAQSLHLRNVSYALSNSLLNQDRRKVELAHIPEVLIAFRRNGEMIEQRLAN